LPTLDSPTPTPTPDSPLPTPMPTPDSTMKLTPQTPSPPYPIQYYTDPMSPLSSPYLSLMIEPVSPSIFDLYF
jgi:hypothetical protein